VRKTSQPVSLRACLVPGHSLPSQNLASMAATKVGPKNWVPQSVAKLGKKLTLRQIEHMDNEVWEY
jgi:hypothetical protein